MIATVLTKTFQEVRYMKRLPDAGPDAWEHLSSTDPIDTQVARWVNETGAVIDNVSSPGISQLWTDKEMTVKCIIVSFVVMYYTTGRS